MDERQPVSSLPTGTVTFVLADAEGSVRLWEAQADAMALATARYDALVSELVDAHGGARPKEQGEGDSFVAVFGAAHDAVSFALALQRALHTADWATSLPLRVRMALHTGPAQLRDPANYMGPTVNRCARIRALAHGGQVVVSSATTALLADDPHPHVTLVDLGVHPLRDFERPERVFQLGAPELPEQFPPLRAPSGSSGGLPTTLTSFVARRDEIEALDGLLSSNRLVTLTGAGGSGKTRLALEFARRQGGEFADGVAWTDAAPIADGSFLVACVAAALGVRETPAEPLVETVVRETRDRDVLLVIDNCEHLIEDAAHLVERLLSGCHALRIVATSREALGVAGERAMAVPSLDQAAATELFVDRARAAHAGFTVTAHAEPAITEICRRLDGIPLAIELAAARVRVLAPQQIADGLADRFRLLTGGSRTALPRQRTLEASVDWSYRLLSNNERALLNRLSVFSGGFSLDAVRAVCCDEVVNEDAVLDLLTGLVDKSLVQVDADRSGDVVRSRMLETIRHFARERLAEAGDSEAVRDRHLRHFLALADAAGPHIEHGDDADWLNRLESDVDNLRAALDWAEEQGKSEMLLRFGRNLWLFWEVRCRFDEGCTRLRTALAAAPEPSKLRANTLWGLADMSLFTLDQPSVVHAGEEVLAIGEHLDDPAVTARGTTVLSWAACFGAYRDTVWARDALTAMLRDLQPDEGWLHSDANGALGVACVNEGDLRAATSAFERAVQSATTSRSAGWLVRGHYFRGWVQVLAGDVASAEPDLHSVGVLSADLDETFFQAVLPTATSAAKFRAGDPIGAEADASEALALGERYGNPFAQGFGALTLAMILIARGEDDPALVLLEDLEPFVETTRFTWVRSEIAGLAAIISARRGDRAGARGRLDAAGSEVARSPYARGVLALHRGWSERITANDAAAESAFVQAVESAAKAGARRDVAEALDELGVSAARREQHERAARLFGAAGAERARLGIVACSWVGVPDPSAAADAVRAALGADSYVAQRDAGAAMTLEEAVRFALRGKGGRRRPTTGWDSLTPTELEVVRLVREGLSNPAIAEKLLITRGTVKVHLSHVFTKLDVTSRAELAAEAAARLLE